MIKHFPTVHLKNGAVSYRVNWNSLSFFFFGDWQPNTFMIKIAQNIDVLIYPTFAIPRVFFLDLVCKTIRKLRQKIKPILVILLFFCLEAI